MVRPDGQMVELPASQVPAALAPDRGYQLLSDDFYTHEAKVDRYATSYGKGFNVGAQEALNQLSFGVSGTVADHTLAPDELEGIRRANEAHPVQRWIGGGVGLATNLLLTEGLGALAEGSANTLRGVSAVRGGEAANLAAHAEGLAPGAARTLGERVAAEGAEHGSRAVLAAAEQQSPGLLARLGMGTAKGALAGAAYSTPQALANEYYGDTDRAAESLLWGVGTGAFLGLGGASLSEAMNGVGKIGAPLKQKLVDAGFMDASGKLNGEAFDRLADEQEAQRMGLSKQDLKKIGKARADNWLEYMKSNPGVKDMTNDELRAELDKMGQRISDHSTTLDSQLAKATEDVRNAAAVKSVDLANDVQSQLIEKHNLGLPINDSANKFLTNKIVPSIEQFTGKGTVSLGDLQKLKNTFSEMLSDTHPLMRSKNDKLLADARDIITQTQHSAIDRAYNALGVKSGTGQWLADKKAYGVLKDMVNFGPQQFDQFGNPLFNKPTMAGVVAGSPVARTAGAVAGGVGRAIGHAVGSAIGGPLVGLGMGQAGSSLGRSILGTFLQKKAFDWSVSALRATARNTESLQWLGSVLAKDAVGAASARAAMIPAKLAARAVGNATQDSRSKDPVKDFLGEKANGLSKQQQFAAVGTALDHNTQNPQRAQADVQALQDLFGFSPELAQKLAQQVPAALGHLNSAYPRPPTDMPPFTKAKWKASPKQVKDFTDTLEATEHPFSVVDHVVHNSLSQAHIDTINKLYPSLKSAIVEQVFKAAVDPRTASLPEGTRVALERLTGAPMTPSYVNYQTAYQPTGGASNGSPRGHGGGKSALGQSMLTPAQKLSWK
jgi:hypothetical protein